MLTSTMISKALRQQLNGRPGADTVEDIIYPMAEYAVDSVINYGTDESSAIWDALDDIDTLDEDDMWALYRFYCNPGEPKDHMIDALYADLNAIITYVENI